MGEEILDEKILYSLKLELIGEFINLGHQFIKNGVTHFDPGW